MRVCERKDGKKKIEDGMDGSNFYGVLSIIVHFIFKRCCFARNGTVPKYFSVFREFHRDYRYLSIQSTCPLRKQFRQEKCFYTGFSTISQKHFDDVCLSNPSRQQTRESGVELFTSRRVENGQRQGENDEGGEKIEWKEKTIVFTRFSVRILWCNLLQME